MHPIIHSSIIYISQDMEANQMSIDRGVDKEDVVHIYNGILLSHKKEWNNAICSNMEIIILSEVIQKEKDEYHMLSLICGI